MNGKAQSLDLPSLPTLSELYKPKKKNSTFMAIIATLSTTVIILMATVVIVYRFYCSKNAELIKPWELEQGPHRFSYNELNRATKVFGDRELLGFGKVYKGVLPSSEAEITVKRISHGAALPPPLIAWVEHFRILRGVASTLLYLHEEWEHVVIHRDVKVGNVLLDANLDGWLSDFGLAKWVAVMMPISGEDGGRFGDDEEYKRAYQQRAVYWMVSKEKGTSAEKFEQFLLAPLSVPVMFFEGKFKMFYNPFKKTITSIAFDNSFSSSADKFMWLGKLRLHRREGLFGGPCSIDALPSNEWLNWLGLSNVSFCPWGCKEIITSITSR
ncbi:hypothetical protein IEQ34_020999 [Dendrobium chrysotoxum]|uniref:Protein kinase domain-containing protein n=1 Tax=Dendrobium chrysotoxum TaxID=161865 RepID=A0AAV7G3L8_DENCH|nr:hypothetical protein IEQ34_020999 [Dendrobium chrysotoxum]